MKEKTGDLLDDLRRADLALGEMERKRDSLKAEMDSAIRARKGRTEERERAKERLRRAEAVLGSREADLRGIEAREERERKRYDSVRTVEAARAVESEMEALRIKKEEAENDLLEAMEAASEAKKALESIDLEPDDSEFEEKEREWAANLAEIESASPEMEEKRTEALAALPDKWRRIYSRIFSSKGRETITEVQTGACGGCFAVMRQALLVEMKSGKPVTCDSCGRIVISRGSNGNGGDRQG